MQAVLLNSGTQDREMCLKKKLRARFATA